MTDQVIGYGKSYASFGEIAQGRKLDETDFLVTLPINLWCTCEMVCQKSDGPSEIVCEYPKSKAIAKKMLDVLDLTDGYHIKINFTRNIPIGKGLSSSTADMLSVVRAFQEVFGVIVTESFVSNIFSQVEAHDGLHHYMSVVYDHRKGVLLHKLCYIPQFKIIAIDQGQMVDTVEYNRNVTFARHEKERYEKLLADLLYSFSLKDDKQIAQIATRSTCLHVERAGNQFLRSVLALEEGLDQTLGVLAAHSGSFAGLILHRDVSASIVNEYIAEVERRMNKSVMVVDTLKMI